jgi:hypothetical protein
VLIDVLAGRNRIATAITTSLDVFAPHTAKAVVLTRDDDYADALAGTPLAVALNGPLLLNPTASLDPSVEAETKRVLPPGGTVYVLGGDSALGPDVETALAADGFKVVRDGGLTRYATAVDIANALSPSSIFLATGVTPADALVAGAAAAKAGGAVLLTDDGVMPAETAAYLAAHAGLTVYALGGPAAAADPAAVALVGRNRYVTGVVVARTLFGAPGAVGFASGASWADALVGGVHMGLHGGPLLLVDPNSMDPELHAYLNSIGGGVAAVFAYGGPSSLPPAQIIALSNALGGA